MANDAKQNFPRSGTVEWISVRPATDQPVCELQSVEVDLEQGLVGDRFQGAAGARRQVTLFQKEHLEVVAKLLGKNEIDPSLTRRNILVSGINLTALKEKTIQIGTAQLEITGSCPPCGKMEVNLGEGGYNAMRGHGGVTASVVQGGTISVDDPVTPIFESESN